MAQFSFTINYPDGQGPEIAVALRARYTTTGEDGQPIVPTTAQAIELHRQSIRNGLRDMVFQYYRDAGRATSDASITPPDFT